MHDEPATSPLMRARLRSGLSVTRLAKLAAVDPFTVRRDEQGAVPADRASAYAGPLGVRPEYLTGEWVVRF